MEKILFFVRCLNREQMDGAINNIAARLKEHGIDSRVCRGGSPYVKTDTCHVMFTYSDSFYSKGHTAGIRPDYIWDEVDDGPDFLRRYFPEARVPVFGVIDEIICKEHAAVYIRNDVETTRSIVYPGVLPAIQKVIFNYPATIVLWADGTKTVVKAQGWDIYNRETGLAMCIAKKAMGNQGNFNNVFRQWVPGVKEAGK